MSIITIKEENYLIYDYNHGEFHTRPEVRVNDEDYKRIIDNIKEFKTIWDYILLFNQTGLVVLKEVNYKNDNSNLNFDFKVAYSMFGTYAKDFNTDNPPFDADTGVYTLGSTTDWNNAHDLDVFIEDLRVYSDKKMREDIMAFYDMSDIQYGV